MPAMCRVAERAEIGIVRRLYPDTSPRPHQPVKLLHGPDHVREMLDNVNRPQLCERVVRERVGGVIQIAQHVGVTSGISVDADCPWRLVNPTPDIEGSRLTHVHILPELHDDGRKITPALTLPYSPSVSAGVAGLIG